MDNIILSNYEQLVRLDTIMNGLQPKYPFQLNEKAKFTQHQIVLYQKNYCHSDNNDDMKEQPSITGGSHINIAIVDM